MIAIVFSKDRAMQLEALLRSADRLAPGLRPVVIYTFTSPRHATAYAEVEALHPRATFVRECRPLKEHVLEALPETGDRHGLAMFMVDDQVFVRPWDGQGWSGLSLRHGLHLRRCYPTDSDQPLPPHATVQGRVTWRWRDGEGDWGYPVSVDAHVFWADEIRRMVESVDFTSPGVLEVALQAYRGRFLERRGWCYPASRVVSIPWNRVGDIANRDSGMMDARAPALLDRWCEGMRIAVERLEGVMAESCHQVFPLELVPRDAPVRALP